MKTPNQPAMKQFTSFITHLKFEAFALAILMMVLTYKSTAPLWILPLTFLLFDVGILGYLKDSQTGAKTYNTTHNFTLPTLLIAAGLLYSVEWLSILGYCWSFHIAVDRTLGFGLKHSHSFQATHLGTMGRSKRGR